MPGSTTTAPLASSPAGADGARSALETVSQGHLSNDVKQMSALPAFMSHTYRTPAQQVSFLCRPH
jgi:hypothetical protein